jgi:hypothetical protein
LQNQALRQILFSQDIWRRLEKEKLMSNENNNRVLSRMGARPLTRSEVEQISGGKLTLASVLLTGPINNPDDLLDQ